MPLLVVVAGPNGSGKTTLVQQGVLEQVLRPPWIERDGSENLLGGAPPPMTKINPDDLAEALAGGGQPTPEHSLQAARASDALLDADGSDVTVRGRSSSKSVSRFLGIPSSLCAAGSRRSIDRALAL